ncbi:MAG: GNAT family N-acetyltransferase [Candidatus Dormibacteria bacterium]
MTGQAPDNAYSHDIAPAAFGVSSHGWIDQVGVAPPHRRTGLASAVVTEATTRMREQWGFAQPVCMSTPTILRR